MEFSILGPVEVVDGETPLVLGGPRQRALLACLLVNANRVVAADRLVDELWATPPRDAHAALQNQVSRLRKVLGNRLVTKSPGYVLRVEDGELDLDRFRSLVAEAGATADAAARSRLLREADTLFRGAPFGELDAPFAGAEAAALDELRLAASEARIDADLDRGRHAELVPELAMLVARHPLRERLRGQHILALYRCGRQAEALEAYRATRVMLADEPGLEPSPALRELERAILRHDPTLEQERVDEPAPVVDAAPVSTRRRRRRMLALAAAALALAGAGVGAATLLRDTPAPAHVAAPVMHRHARARPRTHAVVTPKATPVVRVHTVTHRKLVHHAVRPHLVRSHSVTVITFTKETATAPKPVTTSSHTTTSAPKPIPQPKAPANVTPTVTTESVAGVPSDWQVMSDDFGGSSPNWALWQPNVTGTGATYAQQNGRLELALAADGTLGGQYNMIQTGLFMPCRLDGDFDARVDYTLLQWPSAAGARVQLSGWTLPSPGVDVARASNQYGDVYDGDLNGTWNNFPSQDTSGTLRVARRGGTLTSYYLQGRKWVLLISGSSSDQVTIGLQLFGDQQDWAHKTVRAAFDNFTLAAPASSFSCH